MKTKSRLDEAVEKFTLVIHKGEAQIILYLSLKEGFVGYNGVIVLSRGGAIKLIEAYGYGAYRIYGKRAGNQVFLLFNVDDNVQGIEIENQDSLRDLENKMRGEK